MKFNIVNAIFAHQLPFVRKSILAKVCLGENEQGL